MSKVEIFRYLKVFIKIAVPTLRRLSRGLRALGLFSPLPRAMVLGDIVGHANELSPVFYRRIYYVNGHPGEIAVSARPLPAKFENPNNCTTVGWVTVHPHPSDLERRKPNGHWRRPNYPGIPFGVERA